MTPQQWQRVKQIFGEALDRPPAGRERFIRDAAKGDPDLLQELLRLLKETERESDLLSKPVLANARVVSQDEAPRFAPSAFLARRFRIVRFIARGGMGEVYEAEDMELGERVALKAIRQRIGSNTDLRALFKREIQLARRVTHPNVCRLFDLEQHGDPESGEPVLLLSMELIDGQSLTEYLRQNGPLNYRSALPLIEDIAAGLQAVHDAGIIHGDLKPGNVMLVTRPGETAPRAVVMDFGMAFPVGETSQPGTTSEAETIMYAGSPGDYGPTLTLHPSGGGFVGGTPDYFAPEQTKGEPTSTASDVYAFALVIGDMLGVSRSGRHNPHSDNMPSRWSRILRRCLNDDPASRYSRPAELADALRAALAAPAKTRRIAIAATCALLAIGVAANRIDVLLRGTANGLIFNENAIEPVESPSPDGKSLVGESWDTGDLTIRDVRSGRVRRLTHKTTRIDVEFGGAVFPIFSPDGRHIAYVWRNSRFDDEIRIIGADGKGERTLYHAPENADPVLSDWSSDGSRILFSLRRPDFKPPQLAALALETGAVQFLDNPPPGAHVLFDADGRGFIFDVKNPKTGASEIHRLKPDGTESMLIGPPGSNSAMAWSPDRRRLIFFSDRRGQSGIWAAPVSQQGVEGEPRELVPSVKGWEMLGISRSGALFYRQDTSTVDVYTAVLDIANRKTVSPPRRVTERFVGFYSNPNWSDDGHQLVFHSRQGTPHPPFAIYNLQTGEIRELPVNIMFTNRPQWVEHGAAIMAPGKTANGPRGLYRIDARTGEAILFRSGADLGSTLEGAWSRDGKFHYNRFDLFRKGLFCLNLETGERRVLYVPPPGMNMGLENLTLSPDGKTLAFHLHNDSEGTSSLMLMPAEGGEAVPLFTVKTPYRFWYGSFTWTPDSQAILVASTKDVGNPAAEHRVSEIWRVPVDGSAPVKIDFPAVEIDCLRLNPDGKTIAFSSPQWKSEIWVLQKFL